MKTRPIFVDRIFSFSFFLLNNFKTKDHGKVSAIFNFSIVNGGIFFCSFYLFIVPNKLATTGLSFDPWLSYCPRAKRHGMIVFLGAKPAGQGGIDHAVLIILESTIL